MRQENKKVKKKNVEKKKHSDTRIIIFEFVDLNKQ